MNYLTAYTPLESLFLFQSLLAQGVDTGAFVHISDVLKNNALVQGGETYDPARLSPEALQRLFLLLLRDEVKEEVKDEEERPEGTSGGGRGSLDGVGSPGSRKRKLTSPPLPSLQDAYERIENVPVLVNRLYVRYREYMVKLIQEDERKFANVQRDIQLLEKSEKERLAKAAVSQTGPPALAPREPKSGVSLPLSSTRTPDPTANVQRGPKPNAFAYPPQPATGAAPPTRSNAPGTPPVQLSTSSGSANGPASVLQPPVGVSQAPTRVLQPAGLPPKAVIKSPSETVNKQQEVAGMSQPSTTAAGGLKWEKPYQPPQADQTLPVGQHQQIVQPSAAGHPKLPQNVSQNMPQNMPQNAPQNAPQKQPQNAPQKPPQKPLQKLPPGQSQPQQRQQQQQQVQAQLQKQLLQQQQRQAPKDQTTAQSVGSTPQPSRKSVLVPPQTAGQLAAPLQPAPRPTPGGAGTPLARPSTTGVVPPTGRQIPAQQAHTPRPIAAASPTPQKATTVPAVPPQRWPLAPVAAQRSSTSSTPAPLAPQKDTPYNSPYATQPPRPAIPEHIIRQAAGTPLIRRHSPIAAPQTPGTTTPIGMTKGFGTKWASRSTPSTPGHVVTEPESPAYEAVSPLPRATSIISETPKSGVRKDMPRPAPPSEVPVSRGRGRPPRSAQVSATPSRKRSQSAVSQTDELSMDPSSLSTKIKKETATPRPLEETGDTTADESVHGRPHMSTPGSVSSRLTKRKRQDPSPEPSGRASKVLWTRGFTKVSSSALDQISSHRDANMFATGVREKDAPNYRQIVLQPQDITSIRAAIKQGNKAAVQAANSLPGGDPGTASVLLPFSEDLVPPRGIVNSAQLERELVHMFCNAIMYNPDPDRGPGPAFMRRSQEEEEEIVGYHLDENGVVKNTRCMFVEVEKLLGELRSAEKGRGVPSTAAAAAAAAAGGGQASAPSPADDTAEDEDELAGDGNTPTTMVKRRRVSTRV